MIQTPRRHVLVVLVNPDLVPTLQYGRTESLEKKGIMQDLFQRTIMSRYVQSYLLQLLGGLAIHYARSQSQSHFTLVHHRLELVTVVYREYAHPVHRY